MDNKLLGVLHLNKDKETLKQLGLMQPGKLVQGSYKLNSNFTTANIVVDSTTIEYPKEWTKKQSTIQETTRQSTSLNENVLAKVKERPTLLLETNNDQK